jgi:hypothetical protein
MTKGLEIQTLPKDQILKSCGLDLVPFRFEDVDETYQGRVTDEEVTRYLEVRFADRSMPALRDYAQSVLDDPQPNFCRIIHRASNRLNSAGQQRVRRRRLLRAYGRGVARDPRPVRATALSRG